MTIIVQDINDNDVLFGRGSGPNEHPGNHHFRRLIKDHQQVYQQSLMRGDKAKVARRVIRIVHKGNGRFLRRIVDPTEATGHKPGQAASEQSGERYEVIVDERSLLLKTKLAFQHAIRTINQTGREVQRSPRTTVTAPREYCGNQTPSESPQSLAPPFREHVSKFHGQNDFVDADNSTMSSFCATAAAGSLSMYEQTFTATGHSLLTLPQRQPETTMRLEMDQVQRDTIDSLILFQVLKERHRAAEQHRRTAILQQLSSLSSDPSSLMQIGPPTLSLSSNQMVTLFDEYLRDQISSRAWRSASIPLLSASISQSQQPLSLPSGNGIQLLQNGLPASPSNSFLFQL